MIILAIDPGNVETGFVFYRKKEGPHSSDRILAKGKITNNAILRYITNNAPKGIVVYIEDIAQYGQQVGKSIFDTVKFIGMLMERCNSLGVRYELVYRKTVVTHHTDNPKANDSIIRQFMIDTFGIQGTKKSPGPLYGFAADMFSALAIAMYGSDMENKRDKENKAKELPKS